jgi:hypothetical protein
MAPGSKRPWLTAVRAAADSETERGREDPGEAGVRDVPGAAGGLGARARGAVPVGVAELSAAAPQAAQKRADAGTGCEQDGQGSVTGAW